MYVLLQMKFILGVLLALVASAYAGVTNIELKSYAIQDSDGMAVLTFMPPQSDYIARTLHTQIILPGTKDEYLFRNCFTIDEPQTTISPNIMTTRAGFVTLELMTYRDFKNKLYTIVCPFHAPKTPRTTQLGLYFKFESEEYFLTPIGGILANTNLASQFTANVAQKYMHHATTFVFRSIPAKTADWILRIGSPLNTLVTTALTPRFQTMHPNLTCDLSFTDKDLTVTVVVDVLMTTTQLLFKMPPNGDEFSFKLVCPDVISTRGPSNATILQTNDLSEPNESSFSNIYYPL